MKRFVLYLIRWQLSTPILWLVVRQLGAGLWQTIIANLIGGIIFFWVDRFIFTSPLFEMWHTTEGTCMECGKYETLWRLVIADRYDARNKTPKFYCYNCSKKKTDQMRQKGIKIKGKSK
jgi:hypothetical protein